MDWRRRQLSIAWFVLAAGLSGMPLARGATIGAPQLAGTITSPTLDEISGLVASRSMADVFWVHNDSGDSARFFAMSGQGSLLGTFYLSGQSALDWEDIAIGPRPGGGNYVFLGDIGDNLAVRSNITIHRTTEPVAIAAVNTTISGSNIRSLRLRYPGGPRDAEAMFVDPLSGDLFILTKRLAVPELYTVPATAFDDVSESVTMTALGTFPNVNDLATAADISPDGRFILVRNVQPSAGMMFERGPGESIAEALRHVGTPFTPGAEGQGEAIGWATDGKSFFTTSEFAGGSSAPIHSYAFSAPPLLAGDYNDDRVVDAADYAVWRNQFGEEVAMPNEVETPGVVSEEDYTVWKAHFGEAVGGDGIGFGVPEPSTSVLVLCGCVWISAIVNRTLCRRRQARQPISSGGVSWCLYMMKYSR